MLKPAQRQWLQTEVEQWRHEQLISPQQAEQILARYPEADGSHTARSILSSIGAVVFGLGIILFFAYNWQDLHRYVKLFLIALLFASAHGGAIWLDKKGQRRFAAESLALLGTMLFGAAIWLISQIYHIDEHMPNAFWFWGVAALLLAWARRSEVQTLAALILLVTWSAMELLSYRLSLHHSPWWILLGVLPMTVYVRSRRLLFGAITAFFSLWLLSLGERLDEVLPYVIFAVAVVLVQTGFLLPRLSTSVPLLAQWQPQAAVRVPGMLVYLVLVYLLTFLHFDDYFRLRWQENDALQFAFYCASALSALSVCLLNLLPLPMLSSSERAAQWHTALMCLMIVIVYLVVPGEWQLSPVLVSTLANLVLLGHGVVLIVNGSQQQRGIDIVMACVLLSALVFARFSDLFNSLLARSLAFLLLGTALFLIGHFYVKQKKQKTDARAGVST